MNLISECWIPVRRADGSRQRIAPWQLTEAIDENPILAVASPRPDFDGALTQFLIGLLQTTCTPNEEGWWDWYETPPSVEVLKERFETISHAFELEGEKAFMQEKLSDKSEQHPISYLLIGAATDNAIKQNVDHFQKRPRKNDCLCPACAAGALYTLQTFAPGGGGGGDGKFTSLRGGGPMTTLVLGRTLWETVWLNIVCDGTFAIRSPDHRTFPWLDISDFVSKTKPVKTVYSTEMNPEHVFWGMPRRIQLNPFRTNKQKEDEYSPCIVCGLVSEKMYLEYQDVTGGLTYQEEYKGSDGKKKKRPSWVSPNHPLSPYILNKDQQALAVHPQPGGIGYRHWLGLVENDTDGDSKRRPARTVEQFRTLIRADSDLWAFGYDMDNMKARCWHDKTMPVFTISKELEAIFKDVVTRLIRASDKVSSELCKYLKASLFDEKSKIRVDDLGFVQSDFWANTETAFYDHLRQLRTLLPTDQLAYPILESWLNTVRNAAFLLFDRHSQTGDFDAVDPGQIARARNGLGKALAGAPLKEKILGLPKPLKPKRQKS